MLLPKDIKMKLFGDMQKKLFFNEPYLTPENPACTANEFFKEITYMINLQDIYKMVKTCYYNNMMEYCPILLEIGPQKIIDNYGGCKYLLQVYDMHKKKVFEKPLKSQVRVWANCFQYLTFTLEEGDDCEHLYIVNLANGKVVKVQNFGLDPLVKHICYSNGVLYSATKNLIEATAIPEEKFEEEEPVVDANELTIRKISPGLNILSLLLDTIAQKEKFVLVLFETKDNQVDFNQLLIEDITNDDPEDYKWKQWREIQPKPISYVADPIKKSIFVFSEDDGGDFNYSFTLRESGNVDFYWNMMRMDSTEFTDKVVTDIQMTVDAFYCKVRDDKKVETLMGFDHMNKSSASFAQMQVQKSDFQWEEIPMQTVKNIVYLFTTFSIISLPKGKERISYVAIAHGKYISICNLEDPRQWKWIEHIEFEADVIYMFAHETPLPEEGKEEGDEEEEEEEEEDEEEIGAPPPMKIECSCLTSDGQIYVGFMQDEDQKIVGSVSSETATAKIEGEAKRFCHDKSTLFIIHEKDGNVLLSMLHNQELTSQNQLITGWDRINIVLVQTTDHKAGSYFAIQNDNKITLYQTKMKDDKFLPVKVKDLPEYKEIAGTVHSAASYDIMKHLFLFDEENLYVIKNNPFTIKVHKDLYCIGIQCFTKSYNYAICQQNLYTVNSGLRLFDMERIVNKEDAGMILVKDIEIGTQGYIEMSYSLVRLGFLRSFSHLAIVPILHRNMNQFMGMGDPSEYISYKVIKDNMFALTKKGVLSQWDITTAKIRSKLKLKDHDYSKYKVASEYRQGAVLLKSKEKLEDINDREYFQPFQFDTSLDKQIVVINQGEHCYRKWLLVEIKNELEVEVIYEFIHPCYDDYQHHIFNKEKDKMIEILLNFRTFIYNKVSLGGNKVKWELIRKIEDYPAEISHDVGINTIFSPCFSRYLVTDQKEFQFVVKDTYLDKEVGRIPKEYLVFYGDTYSAKYAMNRTKWVDEKTLLVCSEEGIEKLIDIDDNFKEVGYNARPLFFNINGDPITEEHTGKEYENYAYYFMREDIDIAGDGVMTRLKRCYQQYKSSYFLFNKRSNTELYQDLITVDPYKYNFNNNSFTFLHWSLIEQIKSGEMKVDDLEEAVLEQIIYNILPGGNTILHKLAEKEEELIALFRRSHPNIEESEPKIHVPFLPNLKGKTPIHLCIDQEDYKSVDTILKYLKFYPTDHHSRGIKTAMSEMVAKELPELLPYIESRLQQTEQTEAITKGCLRDDHSGMIPCELWFKQKEMEDQLMKTKPIENRIRVEFVDLPGIYHYLDEEFTEVFQSLAGTQNIEFFNLKVIQKLVDFNYPLVREYITKKLFIPFIFFQLFYMFFMHMIQGNDETWAVNAYYPILGIVILFATYFLVNELKQLVGEGVGYLANFWNYIDLIPPFGIYFIAIMMILNNFGLSISLDIEKSIQAIITFFMWFKFLYFLRIFKNTGYLIRMIIEVIKDMMVFFIVLFITIAAFGDAFLRISMANTPDEEGASQFTTGFVDAVIFTYRMVLGDFDTSDFGNVATGVVMFLWFLCTVFNMIVMLNLLIAIISDSYARVASISAQATFQERCRMIAENHYLIPDAKKKSYATEAKFLMVVTNLEEESTEHTDPVIEKLCLIKDSLDNQLKENKKIVSEIEKKQTEMQEQLQYHQDHFRSLRKLLYMNMPQTHIKVSVHSEPLTKIVYENLKLEQPEYKEGWGCNGKNLCGCQGGKEYGNSDLDETHYHCHECKFDYCEECYKLYGDDHKHELEKLTLKEIMEKYPDTTQWWGCDGRKHVSDCPQGEPHDDMDIIFHNASTWYDLCEYCAKKYKVVE